MMIKKGSNKRKILFILPIAFSLLVIIISILSNCELQSIFTINTDSSINQVTKQQEPTTKLTNINQTDKLNSTNFYNYNISSPITTTPISLETSNPPKNIPSNPPRIFSAPISIAPIPLEPLLFNTYTYCGHPVEQTEPNILYFTFPNKTNQGQIAGSDAITFDTYSIQKIDFEATFITPKIKALGFDEMAIFATSDTSTYKGTEFGIRLDLSDGFLYGYIQEPNGNYGEVHFQMLKLWSNDGMKHHYTMILQGAEVSFYIDGTNYSYLTFATVSDYNSLNFSILAVVHRFTDDWDSIGNNMIVENFYLNKQLEIS